MPTVQEVLKATGLTDEEIKALNPKLVEGVTTILSTAQQEKDAAELQRRAVSQTFENEISPALDKWANEKASYDAKIAAYEAAMKSAKEGGFNVPDILATPATPAKGADGKFVPGGNEVPGSPKFVENLRNEAAVAVSSIMDLNWKHQTLFGKPMPDSPTTLIREAAAQRLDPITYAAKKYDFAARESAIKAEDQKKHDDAIRAEAKAEADKVWAEKVGSNPNIRPAQASEFSKIEKAVKAGERKDPTMMSRDERHRQTQKAIMQDVSEHNATVQ
jgi:hypothetical protein